MGNGLVRIIEDRRSKVKVTYGVTRIAVDESKSLAYLTNNQGRIKLPGIPTETNFTVLDSDLETATKANGTNWNLQNVHSMAFVNGKLYAGEYGYGSNPPSISVLDPINFEINNTAALRDAIDSYVAKKIEGMEQRSIAVLLESSSKKKELSFRGNGLEEQERILLERNVISITYDPISRMILVLSGDGRSNTIKEISFDTKRVNNEHRVQTNIGIATDMHAIPGGKYISIINNEGGLFLLKQDDMSEVAHYKTRMKSNSHSLASMGSDLYLAASPIVATAWHPVIRYKIKNVS